MLILSSRSVPETQQRIKALLERGLQSDVDFENRWPEVLARLLET